MEKDRKRPGSMRRCWIGRMVMRWTSAAQRREHKYQLYAPNGKAADSRASGVIS